MIAPLVLYQKLSAFDTKIQKITDKLSQALIQVLRAEEY
jgi:hypothetical protein